MKYQIAQNPKNGDIDMLLALREHLEEFKQKGANITVKKSEGVEFSLEFNGKVLEGIYLDEKKFVSLEGDISLISLFMVNYYRQLGVKYPLHIYDTSYNNSGTIDSTTKVEDVIALFSA